MKPNHAPYRILFYIGIAALLLGAIDPMEGSVVITMGSGLLAYCAYILKDRHREFYYVSFLMILAGVIFLFYFSSQGGFGGQNGLSWWWASLVAPYPVGWLMNIVLLILSIRIHAKRKTEMR